MKRVAGDQDLSAALAADGRPLHLVPTMGNLHDGHLALVEQAGAGGARVLVSIFVNPTQFGPGEDFEAYPRTPDADIRSLEAAGCDLVWAPSVAAVYPAGPAEGYSVRVPESLSSPLCGQSRPGHFDGVASVVLRLLERTRPDAAYFGDKDYQQLLVIRRMVADFGLPVDIRGVPTVRADDGLALSSRNAYLDADQRRRAPLLYATLCGIADAVRDGAGTFRHLEKSGKERLESEGFRVDYLAVCSGETLGPPDGRADRVFAAAWLGPARLIDNVPVSAGT